MFWGSTKDNDAVLARSKARGAFSLSSVSIPGVSSPTVVYQVDAFAPALEHKVSQEEEANGSRERRRKTSEPHSNTMKMCMCACPDYVIMCIIYIYVLAEHQYRYIHTILQLYKIICRLDTHYTLALCTSNASFAVRPVSQNSNKEYQRQLRGAIVIQVVTTKCAANQCSSPSPKKKAC